METVGEKTNDTGKTTTYDFFHTAGTLFSAVTMILTADFKNFSSRTAFRIW